MGRLSVTRIHGTAVAFEGMGVLLRGASGSGKSDLALRLVEAGAVLVADDQVEIECQAGRLVASPPPTIAGRLEVRGIGIVPIDHRPSAAIRLVVDLVSPEEVERLPMAKRVDIAGVSLPAVAMAPFEAAAVAKVRLALRRAAADSAASSDEIADHLSGSANIRPDMAALRRAVVLVTGLSGAGKTTALKAFEDMGHETVDNLPVSLLGALVLAEAPPDRPLAIGIDVRTRDFDVAAIRREIDRLGSEAGADVHLLFLDCDDDVLARRYTETRRRHPLAPDRPLMDGIRRERHLIAALRDRADTVIDTTSLTPGDMRGRLEALLDPSLRPRLVVLVTSFAYRHGLPRDADLVFDVRFLANPHYDPALRPLSGQEPAVRRHIERDPNFRPFIDHLEALLGFLLPRYAGEGKSYLTIAFGCTGGRHRSVALAEMVVQWLALSGERVSVFHRDIDRTANSGPASHQERS
ncbi:MAG: RNase adapter RapZ [Alphaproteobacteria bacterium]|nr:RNase adapter RapZ [Alphaproteobacteria bacterium]